MLAITCAKHKSYPKRKARFAWSGIMRVIIFLFVVAAPIFFGAMLSGDGISLGGFSSLSDIRQQLTASDFMHDKMIEAREYAATHPGLVEGVKAHRAELQELRSRLCSAVSC
jgi:hypothetical protein